MEKKITGFKTKGMNRDLSVSAFNPEFSFENYNIRLSTNEGNTQLSWVTEKGTHTTELIVGTQEEPIYWEDESSLPLRAEIYGIPVGTAVLNDKLVVFTSCKGQEISEVLESQDSESEDPQDSPIGDKIYLLKSAGEDFKYKCICLYTGDLGFDPKYPLETLVSYESDKVQKVYWVDGIHPLRVINIANTTESSTAKYQESVFNTVPTLSLQEEVTVEKQYTSGVFEAGVIQYCFTYYNKYASESNIAYTTPLIYISHKDRGGAPGERITNAFNIRITNCDTSFDYLTLYSIHRTSLDNAPTCKRIISLEVPKSTGIVTFTDTGVLGETIDPTELLYKNNATAIFQTMAQKDNTLFLGGITLLREENIQKILPQDFGVTITETLRTINLSKTLESTKDPYRYVNQLTELHPCCGFRKGNYYRLGVQFQDTKGYWSEPVFIEDHVVTTASTFSDIYNTDNDNVSRIQLAQLIGTINQTNSMSLYAAGYRKVRALVIFPEINERVSVCKGPSVPTMYTKDMLTNSVLGQPSWIVRNYERVSYIDDLDVHYNDSKTSAITWAQYCTNCEIEGIYNEEHKFRMNYGTRCLFTPDIVHDEDLVYNITSANITAYHTGYYNFIGGLSHAEAEMSSGPIDTGARGFLVQNKNVLEPYRVDNTPSVTSDDPIRALQPLRSGYWYEDSLVDDATADTITDYPVEIEGSRVRQRFLVYLWNSARSLNNDIFDNSSIRPNPTALLSEKRVSNLIFADTSAIPAVECVSKEYDSNDESYERYITDIEVFNQDAQQIIRYDGMTYQGNIDTALQPDEDSGFVYLFKPPSNPEYIPAREEGPYPNGLENYGEISSTYFKIEADEVSPGVPDHDISFEGGFYQYPVGRSLLEVHPIGDFKEGLMKRKLPVRMTYRTTPHILIPGWGKYDISTQLWSSEDTTVKIKMMHELKREVNPGTIFGGNTDEALGSRYWIPCGEAVSLNQSGPTEFCYTYGDSYYQRYDFIISYPYTRDDVNQLTEILSIPVETYVNVDGRYDRNRGMQDNTNISPQNFNLINPIYSQRDNFFSYKIVSKSSDTNVFPNQITWTKTKQSGEEVDSWTQITLASTLELDGDKGTITKLERLDDHIVAFQDNGISQIQYNENVQVSSTEGVPIEIANSGKVTGKRYISNSVGCSNKWSVCTSPTGIYFIDSNEQAIYHLSSQLTNLSDKYGINTWCKQNIPDPSIIWNPEDFDNFVSYYDKKNQEVLFINKNTAVAWSEKLNSFTSFYDYGNIPYFAMLKDKGLWLTFNKGTYYTTSIWEHQEGDYCKFFGVNKPYSLTLIGNPEPLLDKTFTNLELRSSIDGDGTIVSKKFTPYLPFDSIEVWNEYQHGKSSFARASTIGENTLNRKFRIWRCNIPRDNVAIQTASPILPENPTEEDTAAYNAALAKYNQYIEDKGNGISRFQAHPVDRMRNPWVYLKLEKQEALPNATTPKCELHDIQIIYYV